MKQAKSIGIPIFSSVLRSQMATLNWTQDRVASAAQVSQASVNGWLSGSVPRADALYNLAMEMCVTMEFLLTGQTTAGAPVKIPDAEAIRRDERTRIAARLRKVADELEG